MSLLGSKIKAAALGAQARAGAGRMAAPACSRPPVQCSSKASRALVQAQAAYQPQYDPPRRTANVSGVATVKPAAPGTSSAGSAAGARVGAPPGAAALLKRSDAGRVSVRFWLKFRVEYGQSLRIIGGSKALGAWDLNKAPIMQWSDGDLWNVTLDLEPGMVYEYKYVVMNWDGRTAAAWQSGGNAVVALQWDDKEVEVYDNWGNAPGAMVITDGQESTRERKLLAWAGDFAAQRAELAKAKADLAQARDEIRTLRAELGVRRIEGAEAEARNRELEREIADLRRQLETGRARTRATLAEASRLLDLIDADSADGSAAAAAAGASQSKPDQWPGGSLFDILSGLNPLARAASPGAPAPAPAQQEAMAAAKAAARMMQQQQAAAARVGGPASMAPQQAQQQQQRQQRSEGPGSAGSSAGPAAGPRGVQAEGGFGGKPAAFPPSSSSNVDAKGMPVSAAVTSATAAPPKSEAAATAAGKKVVDAAAVRSSV